MTPAWRHSLRAWRLQTSSPRIPKMCPSLSLGAFRTSVTKLGLHTKPRMPPCDFTPEEYQSLAYERVLEIHNQHLPPTSMVYFPKPLLLHQGHMEWLFDYEGNRYLDFFSGVVTVSVGHCHPKVNAVAQKQLGRLWHTSALFFHTPIHEFAEKLSALLPEPLKVIFLVNSGSEANDLAMLMARAHSKSTDIISLRGGYHGCSPYTLGLTNVGPFRMDLPDCCQAKDQYIEQFKDTLNTSVAKSIAGFFAEPIQGVNGVVQYPKGFLGEAFELVRERGGVCVSDEVQTGFGRLGSHFWGFQTHGVLPDIVTMAKGIGNGFPMAAVATTPEIAKSLATRLLHFNTFGGNPMACAIGSAVLEVIKEENLQENSQEVGTYMLQKFAELRDEFEIVGDVRGKGLMIGIEMVKDKVSCEPLSREEVGEIHDNCKRMGLLIGRGGIFAQTFRIAPSLCISKPDVHFAVEVFRSALIQHIERRAK
ncbi:alanine--glyoxylate aminotransferase 2, mitochondrial isoform X3 [Ursus arctos]|uniref:alanine--glyoxylate aminotransferase 2, mitochondrial isoform X3 n=1 Tax=Ursus arctos TaxID=9644 RepID=UPI0020177066|nr:alanine--glyoxylate aminotransferase 2, mitochondrial isoform X3 [Ursus arctos]